MRRGQHRGERRLGFNRRIRRSSDRLCNNHRKESTMSILKNKKIIIIGDRDGIPGPAVEECIKSEPTAEVVFSATECFV